MRVNGKEIPLNAPISLQAFLLEQHYDLRTIAVERNEELMRKSCCKIAMYWKSFTLWAAVSPRKQNRRKFHAEKRI